MASIQITSKFYKNKTAQITFYSSNTPNIPVSLGSYTIPYTRTGTDIYGRYEVYFPIYSKTCSVSLKDPGLLPGANTANWQNCADWDSLDGNLTTVGTNGGPSAYGTYDMCGNVAEIVDRLNSYSKIYRGRSYSDSSNFSSQYNFKPNAIPEEEFINVGFRVASLYNPFTFDNFVGVGDVNNSDDPLTNLGYVGYTYYIGKYEVTNSEYTEFLNAVADADAFGLYNTNMSGPRGGIIRSGTYGKYSYSVKANYGNKPVNWVSWHDCARYCNWLHNNKSTVGIEDYDTTEDGAYTLNGATYGSVARNSNAKYSIPTENEWYKAAYYKGGTSNVGYWLYATQYNDPPSCISANGSGDGPGPTIITTTTTTTTTTLSPSTVWAAVISGGAWDNAGFIGEGTFANPFRVSRITDYPTSRGVIATGYINISFDNISISSGDNFEIAISGGNTYSYSGGILSIPITAGQTLELRPDSTATFRNLRIWWSAPVTTTTTTTTTPAATTTTTTPAATTTTTTPAATTTTTTPAATTTTTTPAATTTTTTLPPNVCIYEYYSDGGGGWDLITSNCSAGYECGPEPSSGSYTDGQRVNVSCVATTTTTTPSATTTTTTIPPNTYNVTNNGSGNYLINGSSNPTLSLIAGQTYTFNINAVGHRFWIKTNLSTGTGNSYNNGVTNNGTDNGTITFVVPYDAQATLYYNCQLHSSMAGNIGIIGTAPAPFYGFNSIWNSFNFNLTGTGSEASPYSRNWTINGVTSSYDIGGAEFTAIASGIVRITGALDGDNGITFYKNGTALSIPPSVADIYSGGGGGYTLNVTITVAANDIIRIGETGQGHFLSLSPLKIWWQ